MAKQGCPNEGNDKRAFGWLICPLQRLTSWKTDKEPTLRTISIGITSEHWPDNVRDVEMAVGLWPPYLVTNVRVRKSILWRMFRIGWRYDKVWKGYIGPSAAFKHVLHPLQWY